MKYLVFGTVFLFVTIFFLIFYAVIFSNRSKTKTRLNIIRNTGDAINTDEDSEEDRQAEKIRKEKIKKTKFMEAYFEKKGKKLSQAYILMKPEEFLLISIIFALIGFLIIYILTKLIPMGIIVAVLAFASPDLYISSIRKKRGIKLNDQLPEALNIISNGLRAGLSFSQAVSVAGKDLENPIKEEFSKVIRDNTLGKTMDDALVDLSKRTDDEDMDMFVTAMIIQRQVGGNLAEVLDTISSTIRERVRIKGEVRTLTAQSKLSAVVISILPIGIAVILYILNPSYMGVLFTTTIGLVMVGVSICMTLIGIFIMSKLVNLEI